MPEYLAPGVYVEETSFRAKSIEGVGTSTTAFVGPTRKGPVTPGTEVRADLPEVITSFADFTRLYGGLDPLSFAPNRPNYLAQAVFNYFNEGGVRLYVMRVASTATPATLVLRGTEAAADNDRVVVRARFAGSGGNGRIIFREILASATAGALRNAPEGALGRARGAVPAEPARIVGTVNAPFNLPQGAALRVRVNNDAPIEVVFRGRHSEAVGDAVLAAADLTAATVAQRSLTVEFDGVAQAIQLPARNYDSPAALVMEINAGLRGGYARLDAAGHLVLGTDQRGHLHTVHVTANATFGFGANTDDGADFEAVENNVANLEAVTVAEIQHLLNSDVAPFGPRVVAQPRGGRLELSTPAAGEAQTLEVLDVAAADVVSAHTALGLPLRAAGEPRATGSNLRLYRKEPGGAAGAWRSADGVVFPLPVDDEQLVPDFDLIRLAVLVEEETGEQEVYDDLCFDTGNPCHVTQVLRQTPESRAKRLNQIYWLDVGAAVNSLALHAALFPAGVRTGTLQAGFTARFRVAGGTDGNEPVAGVPTDEGTYAAAFEQLRAVEDVSIVAAPGHSSYGAVNYQAIQRLLIAHAERPRAYRIAVLDSPPELTPSEVREQRGRIDSHRAALYYPWIVVANPLARPTRPEVPTEIALPPSGFICGIYARNDVEQDVSKAPANEVIRGALRFETDINFAQNQVLNPLGVNCLRFFPGRGYRVWGARTASSDPEWKYVNVRRFFIYLEASIDRGTQWAVFENNGPRLWQNIRETIEDFLYNEWVSNRLLGETPKQAYFVRCDRSTMTQNDLDNGRLICLIGVAALKPAEFVIFRIGQKTADART